MLCFGLFLAILVVVSSAPAGVHVPPPPRAVTLTHAQPTQVLVKVDDDHLDSLEDVNDPHEALEDHLDHIEDVFEDHYGVDLGDLFDVDDDDYYHLRAGYVVRPAVQTIHPVPGPTVVRKYYSTPVISVPVRVHPVVRVPVHVPAVHRSAIPFPVGTKSIGVGAPVHPVGPVRGPVSGVTGPVEPTLSPAVVRKIAEEEVKDAVEDIAENPGIDVHKKAVEVIKEVQEETAEAKKELLEGDKDDDDNDRLPRTA